jgi:ATP-dependent Clp protease, protease subunit
MASRSVAPRDCICFPRGQRLWIVKFPLAVRRACACIAIIPLIAGALVAQPLPTTTAKPKTATIRFIADVNIQTVSSLIEQVEANIRQGITDITVNIASNGGDPMAAIAAYQYLKGRPITLTTHNFGTTASAAVILFAAGSKRYSTSLGIFLIHEPMANPIQSTTSEGQLGEYAAMIRLQTDQMALILSEVTGKPKETAISWVKGHTIWTAKEALANGLINEINGDISADKINTASVIGNPSPDGDVVRITDRVH